MIDFLSYSYDIVDHNSHTKLFEKQISKYFLRVYVGDEKPYYTSEPKDYTLKLNDYKKFAVIIWLAQDKVLGGDEIDKIGLNNLGLSHSSVTENPETKACYVDVDFSQLEKIEELLYNYTDTKPRER